MRLRKQFPATYHSVHSELNFVNILIRYEEVSGVYAERLHGNGDQIKISVNMRNGHNHVIICDKENAKNTMEQFKECMT